MSPRKREKKRFRERIEEPEKNWKFSANDAKEREHWDDYMEAYEDMIQNTASSLDLQYPKVSKEKLNELAAAKKALLGADDCYYS
jgi:hypothetical protein